ETFREQLRYLETAGYSVIPLSDLHDYISGKRDSIPEHSVVITVDDGWRCTYDKIYPELKAFGYPFTVFIYPKFIGMGSYALTREQVREMAEDGVDVQSHSLSHLFLSRRMHRSWDGARYGQWLRAELKDSKKKIEKMTGKPVRFLAYPYGDFDGNVAAEAAEAGYDGALTCEFGSVTRGTNPLQLNRIIIDVNTSLDQFRRHLGAAPLELVEKTPQRELDPRRPLIAAKIANPEQLDPNSVGIALLSLGRTPYSYDPNSGEISFVVREPLSANRQRAVVWGVDKVSGKRYETIWTFYLDRSAAKSDPVASRKPKRDASATVVGGGF
ncbi:MAG TPA: polysaccharide deacetylase family protein, partial [Thermoanaerobaculia bacterium]